MHGPGHSIRASSTTAGRVRPADERHGMSGFTKLVPEIVQSSLWNEPAEIRCVWIAMIATKDESGYVRGDARTISRVANVSLESAAKALAMFQEPDPSSHTPDNEGRRIMPAPGGWIVLNHSIYRASDDVYRAKNRERVRKFREKMDPPKDDVTLPETLQKRYPSASASASVSDSSLKGDCKGGEVVEIPVALNTPQFAEAWANWEKHRKEIRKPLTRQSVKMQMRDFERWGVDRAIAAIEHTIKKGWQGIREPEQTGGYANGGKQIQHRIDKASREYPENNLHAPIL